MQGIEPGYKAGAKALTRPRHWRLPYFALAFSSRFSIFIAWYVTTLIIMISVFRLERF